ncbi:MAG TPA: formate dehydrogenase subunit delta [Planctomycetota bacterium]|nr:formate dehydrogenase subunit delta [Planctomycetota bacterium]
MDGAKLVRMANQIAAFFAAEPDRAVALQGIAGHLKKFWEPRMRREIFAVLDAGAAKGMSEHVREALVAHRKLLEPAAK